METLNFEEIRSQYHAVFKSALSQNDAGMLETKYKSFNTTERDLKSPLDQVFRDVLLELLEDSDVVELQQYVTFCVETCRRSITTPTMPVVLLGDIFEALTLDKCENMFTFVENGVRVWKEDLFFTSCKNNLLRMCNDLLRRLSRTQSTVFCGRILLFLAKFFPFSERSGLNIVSEFNLENTTEYGTDSSASLKETIAELETPIEDKKFSIDFNLYCKFWALQDFFRSPNQCYNKVQWKTFQSHASNVLSAFSSCKLEDLQRKKLRLDLVDPEIAAVLNSTKDENYFAKFLTNQKLLELQLSDANFRRCILLQFLVLFQYLNSTVKFKAEIYELKSDQAEWVKKMTDMVYALLEETPPDGDQFAKIVKHVLLREEHWNVWKNEGCPEFKIPGEEKEKSVEPTEKRKIAKAKRPKRLLGDVIKEATLNNKYHMGSQELTKLWNLCPDNLEACKAKDRDFLPSLDSYFSDSIEQLDPSAMVEEEYKKVNDGNFGWRALRLLARRSPQFFTYSNNPIAKLPDYLEIMIKKIAKEKLDKTNPQDVQDSNQNYSEMEEELLKTEEEPAENEPESLQNDDSSSQKNEKITAINITREQLLPICEKLGDSWKKLGMKFGFNDHEINFYESENPTDQLRATHMLQVWFEDDDDATLENLCYILEGLGRNDVSELIKNEYINNS